MSTIARARRAAAEALLMFLAATCLAIAEPAGVARARSVPAPDSIPRLYAPGVLSTGDDESHAVLSPDGSTVYFLKNTPSFDFWTMVRSRWRGGRWTTPEVVPFSGRYSDADPFLTEDGTKLYFISTRPVDGTAKAPGDTDIWVSERTPGGDWGEPRHLGPTVNSPAAEWFPTVTRDGTLYFGSERAGGRGGADIWRSRSEGGIFQPPENVGEPVNTPAGEYEPMVSPDGRFMVLAAIGRPGGLGAFDLWIASSRGAGWTDPRHLEAPINSPGWDFAPRLTPDGQALLFTSSRGSIRKGLEHRLDYPQLLSRLHAPGNGLRDLYFVAMSAVLSKADSAEKGREP